MDNLLSDLRHALRHARSAPFHALAVVFSVALGVAAVVAVFTVLDAVVLQPLPYPESDRLLMIYETNPERGWARAEVAPANFLDWRNDQRAFQDITLFQDWVEEGTLTGAGEARTLMYLSVFGNFFDVLGVTPALGRGFREEETWSGRDDVVVLAHHAWRREFGNDTAIVGKQLVLDGRTRTIIGVLPPAMREPPVILSSPSSIAPAADLFIPFGWTDPAAVASTLFFRQAHTAQAIGRLRPDVTPEAALAELQLTAQRLERTYPETNRAMGAGVLALDEWVVEDGRTPLMLLLSAAVLVLLLTCANVANLMLARGAGRMREMAVRSALGARGGRLARQVLAESVLLGLVGGVTGLILAAWTADVLVDLAPPSLPRLEDASLDLRAFLVGLAVSLAAAVAFGIAPALGAARPQPEITLRGGRSTETLARRRASDGLIALQIALAVTVLAGAGLLFRTFSALRATDPGFNPDNVVALHIAAPASRYPNRAASHVFLNSLRDRLAQLPGVERTALTSRLPLSGGWTSDGNVEFATSPGIRNVGHRDIAPGYLATVGTELLAGRDFTERDGPDAPPVVILNQTAAQQFLRGENPLGRRITFDYEAGPTSIWYTVVGVVENTRHDGLRTEPRPEVLGSFAQQGGRAARVLIRTTVDPLSIVDEARAVLRELDADVPIQEVRTLQSVVADAVARERFLLVLMSTFAVLALILAAIGVYGTTAHAVRRRTAEIGVRMALGAQPRDVATWVLRFAMRPVTLGTVLGLGGALLAGRLLRNLLFGVAPADPTTLGLVAAVLLTVPLLTALLPATRAARTEPLRVLREE